MIRPFTRTFGGVMLAATVAATAGAQAPGEVRGLVTSARTGAALADVRVELLDGEARTRSSADGRFTLRGVSPGEHRVRATALGFGAADRVVRVANGRTAVLDVEMIELPRQLRSIAVRAARDTLPVGAVVITRAAIDSAGSRDLAELLQAQAGVVITRAGGPGAPARASIRGSSGSEVLVLVDGVPADALLTGEADLSLISLASVEQVTVLRGAQSARYGARALAGVILVETRRDAAGSISLDAAIGSWGERSAALTAGTGAGAATASLVADLRRASGAFPYDVPAVRGGGEDTRSNAATSQRGVAVDIGWEREQAGAHIRAAVRGVERGMPGSIVQPTPLAAQSEHRSNAGGSVRATAGHIDLALDVDAEQQRSAFDDPQPSSGAPYHDRLDVKALGGAASARTSVAGATLAAGADARTLHFSSTTLTPGAPAQQRAHGVWASLRVPREIAHSVRLELEAGLRSDGSSLLDGRSASPRVALSATRGALFASVSASSAFNPPSLADQFFHEGVQVRANPALQPERVHRDLEARLALRDVEAGALHVSVDAAAYSADVSGMIIWTPDFRFVWSPGNFDVRRSGAEGAVEVVAPSLGATLRAALARSSAEYTGAVLDGQVAYRPRNTAMLGGAARVPFGRVELSSRFIGERRTVPGSSLNALPSYWLTDGRVVVPLTRRDWHADVALAMDDLFDARASMLPDYPYPGRTLRLALQLRRALDPS